MTQLEDARILASSDLETMREPFRFILNQLDGSPSRPSSNGSGRGSPRAGLSRSKATSGNLRFLEENYGRHIEVKQQEEVFARKVDQLIQ